MKPIVENIDPNPGSSFFIEKYRGNALCRMPFWHVHPEYEIVYIKEGSGTRCVGSHISNYYDGELIMLGPNIPHQPFSNDETPDNEEVVIQFKHRFFTEHLLNLPEAQAITALFYKSQQGIIFSSKTKHEISPLIEKVLGADSLEKLIAMLELLHKLATSTDYNLLKADSMALEIKSNDHQRMNLIYDYVANNFHKNITIDEVAHLCSLTTPSFCRFFKKTTGKTFVRFLNEYRIVKAQELLSKKTYSMAYILERCGFNDLAYFSKLFKKFTGYAPTVYVKSLQNNILIYD